MDILKLSQYQERSYNETPSPQGWVNYGDDNLFPQYLVDLYKSSAVHGALCNTISQMVFGNGVSASDIETRLKLQEWGFDDELRKACLDLKIQGGFALEIGFSIDRTTIASIKHCPFENLRSAEANEQDEIDFYWFSRDWSDQREEPVKVKGFDPEHKNEYPNQVLYVKPFAPGSFYYPKPDYIGAVNYIELDKEISKYHVNNIRNGLAPSFTIHFKNGVPAPEERRKIRNDIERQLSGTTNAGKFIVTYSDQPDRKPDFEPFPLSDADKQYEFLSTEATDKVMIGHRVVSPAMFGVKTAGQLGNQQELDIASDLFDEQVIQPFQRVIKDAVKRILVASGLNPSIVIDVAGVVSAPSASTEEATQDAPQEESTESVDEVTIDKEASYNGAQITSGLDIIVKVGEGLITKEQAIVFLIQMLQFDPEVAKALFQEDAKAEDAIERLASLKKKRTHEHGCCTHLKSDYDLSPTLAYLMEKGEKVDESYELIDEVEVDLELEDARDELWHFARRVPGDSKRPSEMDNDIVRIRYKYDGKLQDNSRDFCKKMVRARRVWRKEDIMAAEKLAVNPGFGKAGADTYSIWEFKGGPQCGHRWIRQTYLKKENNRKVSVAEARRIISRLPIEERKANQIKSEPKGRQDIKPRNMPNQGYINPR